jgi:hypothetical protein
MARRAARDLFDAQMLLARGHLDVARLRLAFVVYGGMNRKDWRIVAIDDVGCQADEIDTQLRPVLREQSMPGDVRAWGKQLAEDCRKALTVVLPLNAAEREFLDRLLDHGEIVPNLLTDDSALAQRIAGHPMLEWKAQNVRQHKAKQQDAR